MSTPREILSKFYAENNLGDDGGLNSSSVKIELAKNFNFYFPNFNARRKAVLKHDIHHLITGYTTTFADECEISAWEIGSGCKKYWTAFLIDTSALMIGTPFHFWGVLKAFSRGRKTKNLYHNILSNDEAMDMEISKIQKLFNLDKHPKNCKPSFMDVMMLALFSIFGLAYSILSILILPFIIFYSIYVGLKK